MTPEQYKMPFAALHAPVAPLSWEVVGTLPRTVEATDVVPVDLRRRVIIVGADAEVIPNSAAGGLVAPAIEHIACELNVNGQQYYTQQRGGAASNAAPGASFVSLSSLTVKAPRLLWIDLYADAPDVHVRFKWKRFTAGTPIYEDALITLTLFCCVPPEGG